MSGPTIVQDLVDRSLRPLSDAEKSVGAVLLEDAWNLILTRIPSASDRAYEPSFRALVMQVQCAAVLRVLRNPDGKLEEQIDDYRWRLDSATSTGALYLTDAELALLGAGDGASDGAWTINGARPPVIGWWETPDRWVPST